MLDQFASLALQIAIVILFATALRFGAGWQLGWRSLLAGLAIYLLYFSAVFAALGLQGQIPMLAELKFNWVGKVLAILLTLALMKFMPGSNWKEMGLTVQQKGGSIRPSILVAAGLCIFAWGVAWLVGNSNEPTMERLLYQATLPGLDEELFFRGLLLAMMLKAVTVEPGRSSTWPAAAIVTFLFAAGHTLLFVNGSLAFDPVFFAYVAILGSGLIWIRLRTGSVLIPILAHNIINFGSSFVPG